MVDDRDSMKMPVTPTRSTNTGTTAASKREMPTIRCSCGFSVTGWDEDVNLEAYEEHNCSNTSHGSGAHSFFSNIFSLWGVLIVFLIVAGIVKATGHGNF